MDVARDLGYQRGPRRRPGEHGGAQGIVDVVVSHIEGSWIGRVLEGVERETAATGTDLVLTVARFDDGWVQRVLRRPTLGVITVLVDTSVSELHALMAAGLPVIVIDPGSRPPKGVASIGATNWDGGRLAAEHLLSLGHREIAIVGGSPSHLFSSARIDGFTTALRGRGVDVRPERLVYGEWNRGQAGDVFGRLLDGSDGRPTAVFACSDTMALGVYDAAAERGVRIPEDLSVVGFDDVQEATWASPPLTTVQQPISEMGAAAFRMLGRLRQAGDSDGAESAVRIELETGLVERLSTRPRDDEPRE